MSTNSVSVKELFLATGLPQSSSMESPSLLQKWALDRGNEILPIIDNEKSESIAHNIFIPTGQFEEPDQTPGLVIHIPVQKSLENLVDAARKSVRLPLKDLSRLLYSFARHLQKHQGVLSLVLCADTKRSFLECKKHDVPLAIQTVYHFAGLTTRPVGNGSEQAPLEAAVSCLVPSLLSPLLDAVNHLCAAILSHHAVVLLTYPRTSRTIALIMDILLECEFPPGLVNFAPIQNLPNSAASVDFLQICCPQVSGEESGKIKEILRQELPKKIFWSKKSRSSVIITDTADLESAIASVLEAAVFSGGRADTCPSKILIQETIVERAVATMKAKMTTLRCGFHWDKSADYTSTVDSVEAQLNAQLRAAAVREGTEVTSAFVPGIQSNGEEAVLSPLLLATHLAPTSPLLSDNFTGPLITVISFRTIKEAVVLANNGDFRVACSVWSENTAAAMEIARNVKAATVWINAHHMYDAAVGAAGSSGSGWPVFGKDAVLDFWSLGRQGVAPSLTINSDESKTDDAIFQKSKTTVLDRTYKMYYGGAQKRPENGASIALSSKLSNSQGPLTVHIPDGGQKDLKNAIDSAVVGAVTWSKTTPFSRSQILFFIAENLAARSADFTAILEPLHNCRLQAEQEVSRAVEAFFFWAGQCDKNAGEVVIPNSATSVFHLREALGVIGAVLPEKFPLLTFASLCGAALAHGNSFVVIPSIQSALVLLEFCTVLETSDVPAGVINVVTGRQETLLRVLGQHSGVAGVWSFTDNHAACSTAWSELQLSALSSRQRLWSWDGSLDWENFSDKFPELFRHYATQHKRIWLPSTESFAN